MMAWAVASIYGGYDVISNVPRNVSLAAALVATWFCFLMGNGMLVQLSRLERYFVVEDADESEEAPRTEPEVSGTGVQP